VDPGSEKASLLRRDAEWARLASEGKDIDGVLSYWTDDAVVLAPGLPVVQGKAALRDYVEGSLKIPGFNITWTSTDATVSADGSQAYIFSRNVVTMNGPDGTPIEMVGRAVTIWRREADGEWRCAVDIWNAEP